MGKPRCGDGHPFERLVRAGRAIDRLSLLSSQSLRQAHTRLAQFIQETQVCVDRTSAQQHIADGLGGFGEELPGNT